MPSCSTCERSGKLPSTPARQTVSLPREADRNALSPVCSATPAQDVPGVTGDVVPGRSGDAEQVSVEVSSDTRPALPSEMQGVIDIVIDVIVSERSRTRMTWKPDRPVFDSGTDFYEMHDGFILHLPGRHEEVTGSVEACGHAKRPGPGCNPPSSDSPHPHGARASRARSSAP